VSKTVRRADLQVCRLPSLKAWPTYCFALALTILTTARTAAHDPITTKVTWSKEISRIVERRCAGCHRPDGAAPMALVTYEQARPWLRAIKEQVVSRRMPKWPAARGVGDFDNDRSLSPFEIELIAAWVDGGAPKGDARDLARSATPPRAPKPDLRVALPVRRAPPAGEHRTFSVSTSGAHDRWIAGWQFRPNDPAILQAEFKMADGRDLGTWVPPEDAVSFPANTAFALPARGVIETTLWYRSASAQQDFPVGLPSRAPELAFTFADTPPAREVRGLSAGCGDTVSAAAGDIIAVRPIAQHAKASIGVAIRPADGPPRPLTWLREFDPAYQATYRLRDPIAMATDTKIEVASGDPGCRAYVQYVANR